MSKHPSKTEEKRLQRAIDRRRPRRPEPILRPSPYDVRERSEQ